MAEQPPPSPAPETAFLRRVLIVAAVVALALLLWSPVSAGIARLRGGATRPA